jgi:hypothetical protein
MNTHANKTNKTWTLDSPLCIVLKKSQSSFLGFLPSWPDEGDMDLCLPASPLILQRWPSYVEQKKSKK